MEKNISKIYTLTAALAPGEKYIDKFHNVEDTKNIAICRSCRRYESLKKKNSKID